MRIIAVHRWIHTYVHSMRSNFGIWGKMRKIMIRKDIRVWKILCVTQVWKWKSYSLSCVQLFVTSWTVACQDSLSMGFSRWEYWSSLPFPSPGDLPEPETEPKTPANDNLISDFCPPGLWEKRHYVVLSHPVCGIYHGIHRKLISYAIKFFWSSRQTWRIFIFIW